MTPADLPPLSPRPWDPPSPPAGGAQPAPAPTPPSAPAATPPPGRPARPPKPMLLIVTLLLSLASAGGIGAVALYARRLFAQLAEERAQGASLLQVNHSLQDQMTEMRDAQVALQTTLQQVTADRDNLVTQTKRAVAESSRFIQEREALEGTLRIAADERQELKAELEPLLAAHQLLEDQYAELLTEREALGRELEAVQSSPHLQKLTTKLTQEAQGRKEAERAARERAEELKRLQGRLKENEKQLATTATKFEQLQESYTGILAENKTLKRQTARVPPDVTRLARQHEKLVKEGADMHYNLGVLFARNKQYYQAAAEFRKVLELRPDDGDAAYNLGLIYAEHTPDREKALAYFRKYLELKPRASDANWVKQYIASWQAWEGKERLE